MTKIIIRKPHSIVDIITNSSTELFILDKTEMVADFIKMCNDDWAIQDKYEFEVLTISDKWAADLLQKKNLSFDDVIVFEVNAHWPLIEFIKKYFPVILSQHD